MGEAFAGAFQVIVYSQVPGHSDLKVREQPLTRGPSLNTKVHLEQVWTIERRKK